MVRNYVSRYCFILCLINYLYQRYPSIREDLLKRGWYFNKDRDSPFFDLAWTLHGSELSYDTLPSNAQVNHFQNNTCLTTKTGLLHTLQNNVMFFTDSNFHSYFPRGYDLSIKVEMQNFIDDFRITQIETVLRNLLNLESLKGDTAQVISINPGVLRILINILKKYYQNEDNEFINDVILPTRLLFANIESEVVLNSEKWLYNSVSTFEMEQNITDCYSSSHQIDSFLQPKQNLPKDNKERRQQDKIALKTVKERANAMEKIKSTRPLLQSDIIMVKEILNYKMKCSNPRKHATDGNKNMWIVKPAAKSRGRGIAVFQSIPELLKYVEADEQRTSKWFVQKYIENTLLIANRRFDIRQWVLVTSFDPLTIWFYCDCYIRFASEPFNTEDNLNCNEWIENKFRHLVNNSINCDHKNFCKEFCAENGVIIKEHMWFMNEFHTVSLIIRSQSM